MHICLICACMLLQAHIILPHLHHDGIVCITNESSDDCTKCHSPKDSHHTQKHCSDTIDECDIKQIVIRQNDFDDDFINGDFTNHFSVYYLITPLYYLFLEFPDSTTHNEQIAYINTYTSPFTGSIKSLRAPPYFLV